MQSSNVGGFLLKIMAIQLDITLIFTYFCPIFWEIIKKICEKCLTDFCIHFKMYPVEFNKN